MEGFLDDLKDKIISNGRLNELEQIGRINGFSFIQKENYTQQDYLLKPFYIFRGKKKDKRLKGILGKAEIDLQSNIRIYDVINWGDFKKEKTSVYEIHCLDFSLPKFQISPKSLLKQVGSFFGSKKKAFPEEKAFHDKYNIETTSISDLERSLGHKFFTQISSLPNISIEAEGAYLLIYFLGKQIPAHELMSTYEKVLDVLDTILNDNSNEFV